MIETPQPIIDASEALIEDLRKAVPQAAFDRMTRLLYSTDASNYQMMPVGIAFPRDADEVAAAVEVASQHGVPVLPRGGGSSLAGQAVGHALILDLSRYMDQVIAIEPEGRTARVQPGVILGGLNKQLAAHGLGFGPDPASADRATIGGVVGNNATGAHSIRYGMTSDHVLAVDAVLADGSRARFDPLDGDTWETRGKRPGLEGAIYRALPDILSRYEDPIRTRYPNTFRHVAGYNLHYLLKQTPPNPAALIAGSEGTLAVATEVTLNLVPMPSHKRLAVVHFSETRAALEAVPTLLESDPSAIELIDKFMLDLARSRPEYQRLVSAIEGDPQIVLFVEYAGESDSALDAGIARLEAALGRLNHHDPVVVVADPVRQAEVWAVRSVGLGILMSLRGNAKPIPFIEDAAVPVEHLAEYIMGVFDIAQQAGVERVAMYAHASAGCLHVRPVINLKTADGVRQIREIAEGALELLLRFGGTTSGEHGEGISRGEFSEQLFGTELSEAFRALKGAFDPAGIMNPGKVVNTPRMDDETLLRFGSTYKTPLAPTQTVMSFAADGSFAQAVEMCNGAGVCRKLDDGVMCPSFMATRDETHSTRGRANALRAAMTGRLGPNGMHSEELYEVLDLCLSCKACKSECPSAVDMAKLKAEFLHGYQQAHGLPPRSWVFGHIAQLNALGQNVRPLANLLLAGPGKAIMQRLGVHPAREMPRLKRTFSDWYWMRAKQKRGNPLGLLFTRGKKEETEHHWVAFFHDTFMEHQDRQIGQAAIQALEAAGYDPIVFIHKKCCGRPAFSKGMLDEAKRLATHNVALMSKVAEAGLPIIGCEPSCMAMLADEYPDLVPSPEAEAISKLATTIEVFLCKEAEAGRLKLQFDGAPRHVLVHGHCQGKAVFGIESTVRMLELIPNCTVEVIESSCCGMAGSFGYEAEHYDLSIQLAEMTLAPAIREAGAETIICAPGTSCREQIAHTTGRRALHPIEVLADALVKES
jgi:FAD/FMN-containing dehydrogenase/Fe-S oxidoreductase